MHAKSVGARKENPWHGRLRPGARSNFLKYAFWLLLLIVVGVGATTTMNLTEASVPGVKINYDYGTIFRDEGWLDNSNDYIRHQLLISWDPKLPKPPSTASCDGLQNALASLKKQEGMGPSIAKFQETLCDNIQRVNRSMWTSYEQASAEWKNITDLHLLHDYKTIPESGRQKRNVFSGIVCFIESIFGACDQNGVDAESLKRVLTKINNRNTEMVLEIDENSKRIQTLSKLVAKDLQNVQEEYSDTREVLARIIDAQGLNNNRTEDIQINQNSFFETMEVQTNMILEHTKWIMMLSKWRQRIQTGKTLIRALVQMSSGKLSTELVSPPAMMELLTVLKKKIQPKGLFLTYSPGELDKYYNTPLVEAALLTNQQIVISLRIPVVRSSGAYRLWSIQYMQIAAGTNSFLRISSKYQFIGIRPDKSQYIVLTDIKSCGEGRFRRCAATLPVIAETIPTCPWLLYRNAFHHEVSNHCELSLGADDTMEQAVNLHPGVWFISKGGLNWRRYCRDRSPVQVQPCSLCIVRLPCWCGLGLDYQSLPMRHHGCGTTTLQRSQILSPVTSFPIPNFELFVPNPLNFTQRVSLKPLREYFANTVISKRDVTINLTQYAQHVEQGRLRFLALDSRLNQAVTSSVDSLKNSQSNAYWEIIGLLVGEVLLAGGIFLLFAKDYLQSICLNPRPMTMAIQGTQATTEFCPKPGTQSFPSIPPNPQVTYPPDDLAYRMLTRRHISQGMQIEELDLNEKGEKANEAAERFTRKLRSLKANK